MPSRIMPLNLSRFLKQSGIPLLFSLMIAALMVPPARGGLSSENVIVVVNGDSTISRTIANHYVDLRQIPLQNVIVLDDVPTDTAIELETFRDKILKPVLAQLDARKLSPLARVIAYSADFPHAVKIKAHADQLPEGTEKKYQRPTASLNGLTYFYRFVLTDNPGYLSFGSNLYARGKFDRHFRNPFSGELKEKFEAASKLDQEQKPAESAKVWEELQQKHPEMPALALNAAKAFSLSDEDDKAVEMIKAAIKVGWWSSSYLKDTPELDKHLDDPELQKALPLMDDSPIAWQGPIGFSGAVGWATTGRRVSIQQGGTPYMMSCMLAVIHQRGSTTSDAVRILERASQSDRTFPKARFTFGANSGVRAKTRFSGIADASVYLQEHGFETEIFRTVIPERPGKIAGSMVGAATVPFNRTPLNLVPGAIAENLTSYGAAFDNASQTKLTDFLTAGAAMSSGTVAEPYSLPFKFPSPMMYAYYARGLSAIEAFYQSVLSPYQLLIVGDPLAQPFAKAPAEIVDIEYLEGEKSKLRISRRPLNLDVPKSPAATVELSINGKPIRTIPAAQNIDINWPADASGVFDIRATITGVERTEPRISFAAEIETPGPLATPKATIVQTRQNVDGLANDGSLATPIKMKVECEGADRIEIEHFGSVVASTDQTSAELTIETNKLGGGPLRFRPVAVYGEQRVQGKVLVDRP
ncbi:hypothetical protein [Roseiconus lacunae]|uniref:TIGR03790 family protein n=1 Tax=Roseiconus lacunae TaxID=2605694 RepID=A0ABT7PDL7_9BACT|nr:hypothetical protein [Roseiconus lacunae]MDM4014595.1 hypothetical protein [Roseiconus lacunae]